MKLREYIEELATGDYVHSFKLIAPKLVELEAITQHLNLVLGIDVEISVKITEPRNGRFYGKGVIKALEKENNKPL